MLNGTRVLVTGASGFLGSHLTRQLTAEGAEVHAVTSAVSSVYPIRLVPLRDKITLHEANLNDRSAMDALVARAQPEIIWHLGAFTHVGKSWQRVDECVQTNIQGTVNLLEALAATGYRRFVYVGTSEIYGAIEVPFREDAQVNPISPYSVSKYAGERYCRMFHQGHGWPIVMVRPFNAFGPMQTPDRIVPEIIVRALRRQPLRMTTGRQTRELNYAADLVDGFVKAGVVADLEGEILNIGCGEETSMRALAELILELMGNPIEPEFGALEDRPTEIWRMYCDNSKARSLLGWTPSHTLREGLVKTIAWYETELEGDSPFAT
ncbi:MAG: NAD-dependent epimerase/dehydratase family protein [Acidimicrobiales bacterium]